MRVAIVNDLGLAREVLRRLVLSVPGCTVAWTANDGAEAVRKAAEDRPDVVLMDLVMPVVDGVEATRRIMTSSPCPILLVTSSVTGNINQVYQAMGYGGLDAVDTPVFGPNGQIQEAEGLLRCLAKLARARRTVRQILPASSPPLAPPAATLPPLVALGASTGGPDALARILSSLPPTFPAAVVIVQHIAVEFAPGLASWLQGYTPLRVQVTTEGLEPTPGVVAVAATNDHLILPATRRLAYVAEPIDDPYRPSVDAFFNSLASAWPRPGVAVLLTGMGSDGGRGLAALRRLGWHTIAQDQATSVVYGMPRAAAELNAACQVLPLSQIGPAVLARMCPGS